jgi:hypothetical protein
MDTCFECGGTLKIVAKPGRLTSDENLLYEIPSELKISTCTNCGEAFEDSFIKVKIANSVESQKKSNPSAKLLYLRWIHTFIDNMLTRPGMYGTDIAVYCQLLLLLEMRELILSKGTNDKSDEIRDAIHLSLQKTWPKLGSLVLPLNVPLEDLANKLKEFCNVWINT